MKKRADGTYLHEVLVTVKENRMGHLEIEDSSGKDAYLQREDDIEAFMDSCRFIDGDREHLSRGWPCICAVYDEMWSCAIGEEY